MRGSGRSLGVKALSWADPQRARSWSPEPVLYSCPLVDHLNSDLTSRQVTRSDLTSRQVTRSDLTSRQVTRPDLTSRQVTRSDLASRQVTRSDLTS